MTDERRRRFRYPISSGFPAGLIGAIWGKRGQKIAWPKCAPPACAVARLNARKRRAEMARCAVALRLKSRHAEFTRGRK